MKALLSMVLISPLFIYAAELPVSLTKTNDVELVNKFIEDFQKAPTDQERSVVMAQGPQLVMKMYHRGNIIPQFLFESLLIACPGLVNEPLTVVQALWSGKYRLASSLTEEKASQLFTVLRSKAYLLHEAIRLGDHTAVQFLLEHGAEPYLIDYEGDTAFSKVLRTQYEDESKKNLLKDLLQKYAIPGDTPMSEGTYLANKLQELSEQMRVKKELLPYCSCPPTTSICCKCVTGTAFNLLTDHYSVFTPARKALPLIQFILDIYPDIINFRSLWGNTPLHLAVAYDHKLLVVELLKRGANPFEKNKEGQTCFDIQHASPLDPQKVRGEITQILQSAAAAKSGQ